MKRLRFLILTILTCLLGLFAVACNQTIDFDYNIDFVVDGEVIATVGTNGDKIAMPQNPTKKNYTFDGWYWDDGEWDDEFTLNSILDQPLQEKNHYKVYAKWIAVEGYSYTVIFCNNKSESQTKEQTIVIDEETKLESMSFTEPKYMMFDSWNTQSDGKGKRFVDREVVCNLGEQGSVIALYAQWKYEKNVYPISKVSDFDTVRQKSKEKNYVDASIFVLLNDIDFNGAEIAPIFNESGEDAYLSGFAGLFDGNGYVIKNFVINKTMDSYEMQYFAEGFFGAIATSARIQNLGLENFTITSSNGAAFALYNNGTIENCYANGMINLTDYGTHYPIMGGGLVVNNNGSIKNCYIAGKIQANTQSTTRVGGVCYSNQGTIENCLVLLNELTIRYNNDVYDIVDHVLLGIVFADPYDSMDVLNCWYHLSLDCEVYVYGEQAQVNAPKQTVKQATEEKLNSKDFYVDTLGWSEDIWDFSGVNYDYDLYPILKQQ